MIERLNIGDNTIAYDMTGEGLSSSSRRYRRQPALLPLHRPTLAARLPGCQRGHPRCGDSSLGWDGYSRTDIAGDLVALVRHLGDGPAVIIGQSISAAPRPSPPPPRRSDLGLIELAPFTRAQSYPSRAAADKALPERTMHLTATLLMGSLPS